jgi:sugar phosphate isomerase/epimerase
MMKLHWILLSVLAGCIGLCSCATAPKGSCKSLPTDRHPAPTPYKGWHLGMQSYSFKEYTFFEAIDKTASLGLHWIEAYPSQTVSAEWPGVKFIDLNPMQQIVVKRKLAEAGITLAVMGVVDLTKDEAVCRKVFDFARAMGVGTLAAEPPQESMPMIDKLAQEYKIKVAIHNHPKPSRYWDPKIVLAACQGRSQYIGACADTGHWMRSGVDPVEAIRMLKGRIISVHLKDLNAFNDRQAHDMPWGTGVGKIAQILKELHQQGFQGNFSIEYEYNWTDSVPQIRQCVEFFNKTASELQPSGWHDMLTDGLNQFNQEKAGWKLQDGVLERVDKSGFISTKQKYGDFILDLEFKIAEKTNSGVFIRIGDLKDEVQTGIEVQVLDSVNATKPTKNDCGSIYDCLAPSENTLRPIGEWNRMTITAVKNKIYVVMNGKQIIDMDLNQWTKPHQNPDGTPNKFNTAYKDMPRTGFIGFQDHGTEVWYRNVWIKPLN